MNDSLNICLSCGLCCDGTLIGYVKLGSEELPALRELLNIEEEGGKGFFLQPCKSYCDGCTIYSNRPKQCDNFKCGLLKSVEQKELSFDTALERINAVSQKKISIEKKIAKLPFELESNSFYFKMTELKTLLYKKKAESPVTQNQLELIPDLEQLNSLISKNFGVSLF
jgi:Fe-S-cluster containining protein|tara:strand:- start:32 stop:535 length:504 start_codon:yes stop_codon:yes gene_type:complete